jgi:hypothetical protein
MIFTQLIPANIKPKEIKEKAPLFINDPRGKSAHRPVKMHHDKYTNKASKIFLSKYFMRDQLGITIVIIKPKTNQRILLVKI